MLKLPRLKYHVQIIGIEKYLRNNDIYEHKYIENIKNNLYKQAGKCEDQQQLKDILEDDIASTHEGFTNNSPISPMTSKPIKKPSAQKSLCLFTNIFEVKKKTAYRQVGADKSQRKTIQFVNKPRALKQKRKGSSQIDEQIKKYIYNWIMHHPQVVQSPIFNNGLKVKIDGHTELQLVPNFYCRCLSENFITTLSAP